MIRLLPVNSSLPATSTIAIPAGNTAAPTSFATDAMPMVLDAVVEAIPANQKVFHSVDDLPIADKPLIVVFKDKDIISAEYCNKHDAWHTQHGNINVRQIHQWAYVEDFYNQLNLPKFPEHSKRPDPSELIKGLKGLFEALSDAAVEVHVHKVNSKGNSLKDMFDEVFGEKSDIFKSNSKH